jgi:hypothetical protein
MGAFSVPTTESFLLSRESSTRALSARYLSPVFDFMMNTDDFFKRLDANLSSQKEREAEQRVKSEVEQRAAVAFVDAVVPDLSEFRRGLESRGIAVDFSHWGDGFRFRMLYADGGHSGFELTTDAKSDGYTIFGLFTNDDGRNYRSIGTVPGGPPNWDASEFRKHIEESIERFMLHAHRHGGAKRLRGGSVHVASAAPALT